MNDLVIAAVLLYERVFFLRRSEKNRFAFFRIITSSSLAARRFSSSRIRRSADFRACEFSGALRGFSCFLRICLFSERRPSLNSCRHRYSMTGRSEERRAGQERGGLGERA